MDHVQEICEVSWTTHSLQKVTHISDEATHPPRAMLRSLTYGWKRRERHSPNGYQHHELPPFPDSMPAIPVAFEDTGIAPGLLTDLNSPIIQCNRRNKMIFRPSLLLAPSVTF